MVAAGRHRNGFEGFEEYSTLGLAGGHSRKAGVPISERTFRRIEKSLRELYMDAQIPWEVRRRILEASVRAPQDWHESAVRSAYASGDDASKLTAVFCMRFVRGFDEQIAGIPAFTSRQSLPQETGALKSHGRT